mgnify:CR=1 FL=1
MKYQNIYDDKKYEIWITEDHKKGLSKERHLTNKEKRIYRCQLINKELKADTIFYSTKKEVSFYRKRKTEFYDKLWNELKTNDRMFIENVSMNYFSILEEIMKQVFIERTIKNEV